MTSAEALDQRIPRIRISIWNKEAYLRLPLLPDDMKGPWAELYDERSQQSLGIRPGSQRILIVLSGYSEILDFIPYAGPISEFEQHPDSFAKEYCEA